MYTTQNPRPTRASPKWASDDCGYAAVIHRGLPAHIHMPAQKFPDPAARIRYAPLPAPIRQI
jgi:hypothetical protein